MMAGRVVLGCLFCKSSPGDEVLQPSGVALNCIHLKSKDGLLQTEDVFLKTKAVY